MCIFGVRMKIIKIQSIGYESNCWLLLNEASGEFAVVDPSPSVETISNVIDKYKLEGDRFKYILLTHGHFDHIYSVDSLRDKYSCKVCIHTDEADYLTNSMLNANKLFFGEDIVYAPADILLSDHDELKLGDDLIKVIHTPGHTMGCVCYQTEAGLITGDTLFDGSIGRTDLPGGDYKTILNSLKKIAEIDGDTVIYPGHGDISTIDKQLRYNPYLKGI